MSEYRENAPPSYEEAVLGGNCNDRADIFQPRENSSTNPFYIEMRNPDRQNLIIEEHLRGGFSHDCFRLLFCNFSSQNVAYFCGVIWIIFILFIYTYIIYNIHNV
jgi:hypothetical protein